MRTERIEVDSERIAFLQTEAEGGVPVVFVHGAGGTKDLWRAQMRALDSELPAVALDLPSHGESSGEPIDSIEGYVELFVRFLDALGCDEAIVCGHSMGGATAQMFALSHTDRARALVLVATGARLRVAPVIFELLERDVEGFYRLFREWGFGPNAKDAVVESAIELLRACHPGVVAGDFRACDRFDMMDEVRNISVPVLVVGAEHDALTPPKYSRYLADSIPDARLELIDDSGHMIPLEQPSALAKLIGDFARSVR